MNFHQLSTVKLPFAAINKSHVPNGPGIYLLFHTNIGAPAYVGRSDSSLYDSLRAYTTSPVYKYFKFMPCKDRADAYQWECIFWHKAQPSLDNAEARGGHHPYPPRGVEVRCPVPGCTYEHVAAAPPEVAEPESEYAEQDSAASY